MLGFVFVAVHGTKNYQITNFILAILFWSYLPTFDNQKYSLSDIIYANIVNNTFFL